VIEILLAAVVIFIIVGTVRSIGDALDWIGQHIFGFDHGKK
jgi:hypothetical protein